MALTLAGLGGSALRAQELDYLIWLDGLPDTCSRGETITVRVMMEIQPGAAPVIGWRFGLCHDPALLHLLAVNPGSATQGGCADNAVVEIPTGQNGFGEVVILSTAGGECTLAPGCHELAVANYECVAALDGLRSRICFCDQLDGVEIAGESLDVSAFVSLDHDRVVVPTLTCEPHECQEPEPTEYLCDCTGREFWLAFPGNFVPEPAMDRDLRILIASEFGSNGRVEVPGIGFVQPFAVAAGDVTEVVVPFAAELGRDSDTIDNKGVHVISDDNEIQVHALNRVPYSVDGFLALPVEVLGREYIILGYKNVYTGAEETLNGSQFAIVATTDGTTIAITPTVETDGHPSGVAYMVSLNRGETYQLSNHDDAEADLSGTVVSSTSPVAVFGSHFCATIPGADVLFCNHNVEQLPPTGSWGRGFVAMPFATRSGGDTFRILAMSNGTGVVVDGVLVATLNRGKILDYEQNTSDPITIAGTRPILVAQHARGSLHDGVMDADSSMMLLVPFEQYRDHYIFESPSEGFDAVNYANVIAPPGTVGQIRVDGVVIPAASFSGPIGGTLFEGAQVPIAKGVAHHFTSPPGVRFGVQFYGFDEFDAYAMPGCVSYERRDQIPTTSVTRSIVEQDPCDDVPARVSLTAEGQLATPVTVIETLPQCARIVDAGEGIVFGNTITFEINAGQTLSYEIDARTCDVPADGLGSALIIGEVGSDPCPDPVRGDGLIEPCDRPCDTHCTGLDVIATGAEVDVVVSSFDESDDVVLHTLTATNGVETINRGPQAANRFHLTLTFTEWTITVFVSDGLACNPPRSDASCSTTVNIVESTRPFKRGDVNNDTILDISDVVFVLLSLFSEANDLACLAAGDANGDGSVDVSDAIYLLNWQFQGGPSPVTANGDGCTPSEIEGDIALGCEESSC